ncbi:MAG: ion channel [Pseudomonadota bacterium]
MEKMLIAIVISAVVVTACLYLHFTVLRHASGILSAMESSVRRPMIMVMAMIFLTHLAEIVLFAIALWIMTETGLGNLVGAHTSSAADFFYYSIGTYTTLGIGDIMPVGPVRILTGIEALTGLLLIAWSASFTYLAMERLWHPKWNGRE